MRSYARYALIFIISVMLIAGMLTSAAAASALQIIEQPTGGVYAVGEYAYARVVAEGDDLTYKWYYKYSVGSTFYESNRTADLYAFNMAESFSGLSVYCVVTDAYGNSVTTDTAEFICGNRAAIAAQPQAASAYNGDVCTVSLSASGDGISYKWYIRKPGAEGYSPASEYGISADGASVGVTMSPEFDGASVICKVTDEYGLSVWSKSAVITMREEVRITAQPNDAYALEGEAAEVSVSATGEGLTYQWYFRDSPSANFSKSSLTDPVYSTQMNSDRDGRELYCVVTDKYGTSVSSESAYIRMGTPVSITSQPVNAVAPEGTRAYARVTAEGDGLTYQWFFSSGNGSFSASSVTAAAYSVTMDASRDGRMVYCVITDKFGNSVTTDTVTLTMGTPARIITQPANVSAASGKTATVTLKAEGDGLSYAWYYKNKGASSFVKTSAFKGDTYAVEMTSARSGRQLYCVITDKYGNSVTSDTVTITLGVPVKLTQQPEDAIAPEGKAAKVTIAAEGEGLTYTWYYKNKGASSFVKTTTFTGDTYSTAMNAERDGRQVYCVIKDKYGNSVKTDTVTLIMGTPAAVTRQPASVSAPAGGTAKVTFAAKGDGLTYTWYYKNRGASSFLKTASFTGNTYSVSMNAERDGRQVYCVIKDKYGNSVTTDTVTISMKHELQITSQPVSAAVAAGEYATVRVHAAGDGLTYEWYFKNAGASKFSKTSAFTSGTYSVEMNASRDGRQLYCVISDKYGNSVKSDTVTISMDNTARITIQPRSVTAAEGETATVTLKATGDGLTYAWYYKSAGMTKFAKTTAFTGNSYYVEMNASRDGRQLYCVVTDKYGNSVKTDTVTISMK